MDTEAKPMDPERLEHIRRTSDPLVAELLADRDLWRDAAQDTLKILESVLDLHQQAIADRDAARRDLCREWAKHTGSTPSEIAAEYGWGLEFDDEDDR